jgi:hypothetical protein
MRRNGPVIRCRNRREGIVPDGGAENSRKRPKPGSLGGGNPPALLGSVLGVWFYLASLGNDAHYLHKPTMMRVL